MITVGRAMLLVVLGVAVSAATIVALMPREATVVTPASAGPRTFTRESDIDRSGDDIRKDILVVGQGVEVCEQRCRDLPACVAFTYVKQSTTVPAPIFWLKRTAPYGHASSCCISGALKR